MAPFDPLHIAWLIVYSIHCTSSMFYISFSHPCAPDISRLMTAETFSFRSSTNGVVVRLIDDWLLLVIYRLVSRWVPMMCMIFSTINCTPVDQLHTCAVAFFCGPCVSNIHSPGTDCVVNRGISISRAYLFFMCFRKHIQISCVCD